MMLGRVINLWHASILLVFCAGMSAAQIAGDQKSPILTVESDRLFSESAFGERVAIEIEAEQSVLLAENRKIEAELTAEEKRLTEMRKEMAAKDFRAIADAFDRRVQDIRIAQDAKVRAIGELGERERSLFIRAAQPILVELMRETGAGIILERRSVFISVDAIDITDKAIGRLDLAIGDGGDLSRDQ